MTVANLEAFDVASMKFLSHHSMDAPAPITHLRAYYEAKAFGFLAALYRRKWMIGTITLLTIAVAAATVPYLEKQYTADALIQLDLNQMRPATAGVAANIALEPAAMIESEARIIRSRTIARRVVVELDLVTDPTFAVNAARVTSPTELVRSLLSRFIGGNDLTFPGAPAAASSASAVDAIVLEVMKGLEVHNDLRSYLITITYTAGSPADASRLANAFADEYLESQIEASFASSQRTSEWLRAQIEEVRATLRSADREIQAFREANGLLDTPPDGISVQQQQLLDLNSRLSGVTASLASQTARLARARDMIANETVPSASDLAGSPIVQQLIAEDHAAKQQVTKLSNDLGEKHPLVAQAHANLREAEARLWDELRKAIAVIETDVGAAEAEKDSIQSRIAGLERSMINARAAEQELQDLQANADALRTRLQSLINDQDQANALAELRPVTAELVMPAEAIAIASSPNAKIILLIAGCAGLIAGAALVYLLELRDTGFRTEAEVTAELGVRCVGMVPQLATNADGGEKSAFREATRAVLATGIDDAVKGANAILITSALPQEGKTVLAYALAGCIVSSGRTVLVLNVGSRERINPPPSIQVMLNLDQVLSGDTKLSNLLPDGRTVTQPVVIRCDAAPKELADLFTSPAFEQMLAQAKSLYDVVLIEAPATILYADALVLGRHTDFVLHTIRWNETPKHAVATALRRLSGVSLNVKGVVLTRVHPRKHRKYFLFDEIYYRRKYSKHFMDAETLRT